MGLFDDLTNFVGEVGSLKQEISQFGSELINEITSDAAGVKQTVTDAASGITSTVQQPVVADSSDPLDSQENTDKLAL